MDSNSNFNGITDRSLSPPLKSLGRIENSIEILQSQPTIPTARLQQREWSSEGDDNDILVPVIIDTTARITDIENPIAFNDADTSMVRKTRRASDSGLISFEMPKSSFSRRTSLVHIEVPKDDVVIRSALPSPQQQQQLKRSSILSHSLPKGGAGLNEKDITQRPFLLLMIAAAIVTAIVLIIPQHTLYSRSMSHMTDHYNHLIGNSKSNNKLKAKMFVLPESHKHRLLADDTNLYFGEEDGMNGSAGSDPSGCSKFSQSKSICKQNPSCKFAKQKKSCVPKTNENKNVTLSPSPSAAEEVDDPTAGYDIELIFISPNMVSSEIQQAFVDAKERWETVIKDDLSSTFVYKAGSQCYYQKSTKFKFDIVVDDLLIFINLLDIDGVGGTLGSSGPCMLSSKKKYPRVGLMQYDLADLQRLYDDGSLASVILHEMAHVIGIGTMWDIYNLKSSDKEFYLGQRGSEGLVAIKGSGQPLIETNGPPGTVGGHWDEATYKTELMTGWLSQKSKLSLLTAMSLEDIGYKVNPNAVDTFEITPTRRLDENEPTIEGTILTERREHDIGDDIIHISADEYEEVPYIDGKPQNLNY